MTFSAGDYIQAWTGGASAARWVLDNVMPILLAAGATRVVTFIYNPRR